MVHIKEYSLHAIIFLHLFMSSRCLLSLFFTPIVNAFIKIFLNSVCTHHWLRSPLNLIPFSFSTMYSLTIGLLHLTHMVSLSTCIFNRFLMHFWKFSDWYFPEHLKNWAFICQNIFLSNIVTFFLIYFYFRP